MRGFLGVVAITSLLGMTISAPAEASVVDELWFNGTFTLQRQVVAGDVNGDGLDDIVSFNLHRFGNRVLLSNGSGFGAEQNWGNSSFTEGAPGSEALFVADMNADSRADSVVVRLSAPRGLYVAKSETTQYGGNRFGSPSLWLDNSVVGDRSTMTADVDADGDADVIGLYGSDIPVLVARSNGTSSLPLATWGPPAVHGDKASLAADTNGDGAADLILVDTTGVRVVPANPRWWGTPEQWSTTPFYGTKKTLTGDIDADGDADLIAVNDTDVQVMRSTGTSFAAPEPWHPSPFVGTWDTLAADVDGDGDDDLVAVNGGVIRVLRTP
jgi:VCBS repeat protein